MYPLEINDKLWILGNNYFHIYLIKGKKFCALMETGISATVDTLLKQLSFLQFTPDYLIVSHPHSDHISALNCLRKSFPGAAVIAGKGADEFISHPKAAPSVIAEDHYMKKALISRGSDSVRRTIDNPPSLSACSMVDDEDELDLGNLTIKFMEAKGHSPGNILVRVPEINTALISDSFGNHYPGRGFFPTFFTGFSDYMQTIDRLEKINPAFLGLAHNGFFSTPEDISQICQKARQSARDVYEYVTNDQRTDDEIAEDLFGFYYVDELSIYSPQNILNCCRLLVRRVRELK